MLKRLLLILLALLLALPAVAEEPLLEQYAAQAAGEFKQLAGTRWYAELYTGVGYGYDRMSDLLAGYAAQGWQNPTHDVYLSVDEDAVMTMLIAEAGSELDEATLTYVRQQMPMLISAQLPMINTSYEALMLGQMMWTNLRYTDPAQPEGLMTFIRFFEDGDPLLYSVNCADGAVALSCCILPEIDQAETEQVKIWGSDIPDELLEQGMFVIQDMPPEETKPVLAECRNAADVNLWLQHHGVMFVAATEAPILMPAQNVLEKGSTQAETAVILARKAMERIGNLEIMLMMTSDAQIAHGLTEWGEGDFTRPSLMVEVPVSAQTHGTSIWGPSTAKALAAAAADDPARRMLEMQAPDLLMSSVMNARLRAQVSISSYGGMYADPAQPDGAGMYLLLYEDGYPVAVSWASMNGSAVMQAKIVPLDELAGCRTAAEVSLWFMSQGIPVVCSEIPMD